MGGAKSGSCAPGGRMWGHLLRSLALWKVVCFLLIQESTAAPVGSHNIQYTFGPVIDEPRQVGVVDYKNDAHPFTGSEALPAGHPSKKRPMPRLLPRLGLGSPAQLIL